jgi:hypothetical protein
MSYVSFLIHYCGVVNHSATYYGGNVGLQAYLGGFMISTVQKRGQAKVPNSYI